MKRLLAVLLAVSMIISLSSCQKETGADSEASDNSQISEQTKNTDTSSNAEDINDTILREKYGDAFSLTTEQRIDDYNYLWDTLRESYLFWGVIERQDADIDAIYEDYLEHIKTNENDVDFYISLNSMFWRLEHAGHLGMIEPSEYDSYKNMYADSPERSHWNGVLNNEVTEKNYPAFGELITALDGEDDYTGYGETSQDNNVTAFIIPDSKIAYVRINSFDMDSYENDKNVLFDFYDTLGECENLIVDITPNSGGGEGYWMDLIVAPHIEETVSNDNYALVSMSENNKPYIEQGLADIELRPILELPELPKLEPEDRERATHFFVSNRTVEPSTYSSPFKGDITVLTSEYVYSSSEAFAVFSKDTGFAKLVGYNTGGDGIGIDPVYIVLPNSGIIVRYSMIFGLNKDGSSSEEFGTSPDILSSSTESPLATALRVIAEKK